ncbi:F-box and associated interaction domains-containing protein putative isoform 1 [Tripterygium wilfordii]|uniref:F-box and associated interaction domains-containing protein putative isoform 1 n=1 Tax=Tripterygium wilfordii TaxID=458696 RepID=A0A7J7E1B0_TRIWF|nr:F-box and associated interaction domains-containing protein putative isoform 1 [Tripterygium wilfordii]
MDVFPWFGYYSTYKDGVSYCLAAEGSYLVSDPECILSFDMDNEVFEKLALPSNMEMSGFSLLDFMNGNLSLVLCPDEDMEKCFDIWVMTQHGVKESWVKQVSIGPLSGVERPVAFSKNGGLFLAIKKGQLVLYDAPTKQLRNLPLLGYAYPSQVIKYEESLWLANCIVILLPQLT